MTALVHSRSIQRKHIRRKTPSREVLADCQAAKEIANNQVKAGAKCKFRMQIFSHCAMQKLMTFTCWRLKMDLIVKNLQFFSYRLSSKISAR